MHQNENSGSFVFTPFGAWYFGDPWGPLLKMPVFSTERVIFASPPFKGFSAPHRTLTLEELRGATQFKDGWMLYPDARGEVVREMVMPVIEIHTHRSVQNLTHARSRCTRSTAKKGSSGGARKRSTGSTGGGDDGGGDGDGNGNRPRRPKFPDCQNLAAILALCQLIGQWLYWVVHHLPHR